MNLVGEVDTIPRVIQRNWQRWPKHTAMCMKNFGVWQRFSWADYYTTVKHFSLGMISLGLKPKDVVAIIGDNEPEWFWAEFGVQAAQGIPTGVFVDSIPAEVKYIVDHCGARFAIANDQEQTDKFLELKPELPGLEKVVYWDPKGLRNYDDPLLISFREVVALGQAYEVDHPDLFEANVAAGETDDTAFIYYTSGTTGSPKGASISHRALLKTAQSFVDRYPVDETDDLISNFPAAWVGDSFFASIPHLLTGARLNFPEEPETVAEDTREVGPDFVIYGPRQWEGLVSEIQVKMVDAHWLKRFAYRIFMPVGHKIADIQFQDRKPNLFWRALHQVAIWLLFRPLKDKLGLSEIRFAVTGSSVLSLDTFRMIHAIGIELRQNYASTEAGFISSHGKGEIRFESVGRPSLGIEVRIDNEGELLIRSDCMFTGYLNEPEKTAAAFRDGWFCTGDAVHITPEGHLIFLDRVKDMGQLSTGVKYAPQYIEGRLRFSPYIKDAMVIGGKERDYVTAIMNIDFTMISKWAQRKHLNFTTFVDLSQKDEVISLVEQDLLRVNSYLPDNSRVMKFVLLHKEFDPDEAELTRTRKLRRDFMEEKYADLIGAMYGGRDSVTVEAPVTYRDGRQGMVKTDIKVRTVYHE